MTTISSTFEGADVDGLDHLSQEFAQAAQVCQEVRSACEVIVAASFFFGPFGAAFVSYLKGVVIPWLTRIGEALQVMSKLLSLHSAAQKDASSTATSLPSYTSTGTNPVGDTTAWSVIGAVGTALGLTGGEGSSTTEKPEPIAPGTVENSKNFGAMMNKDALEEFEGKESSSFHPTISLGQVDGSAAMWDAKGEHWSAAAGEATGSAGAWAGYDPKDGYQLGGKVTGGLNAIDVKESAGIGPLTLGNQTTIGVNGAAQVSTGYDPATQIVHAGASAEVFAGVQDKVTAKIETPYVSDTVTAVGQLGAGAAANATLEVGGGHVVLNAGAGVSVGLGGKLGNSLDVNYERIGTDVYNGAASEITALEHYYTGH